MSEGAAANFGLVLVKQPVRSQVHPLFYFAREDTTCFCLWGLAPPPPRFIDRPETKLMMMTTRVAIDAHQQVAIRPPLSA